MSNYLGDEIFCNDRSMSLTTGEWWANEGASDRGFGRTATAYGAFNRFIKTDGSWNTTDPNPQFTCPQGNDMFTVNARTINGKTTNGKNGKKIGLITADEIVAAGAIGGTENKYYYLFKNSSYWYWSLSPGSMAANGYAYMFHVYTGGYLGSGYDVRNTDGAVAPVINISSEYAKTLVGNGTMISPYQIPGVE